ncbi:hypothetical protein ACFQ3Z_15945 [Streptomyces nogalater]
MADPPVLAGRPHPLRRLRRLAHHPRRGPDGRPDDTQHQRPAGHPGLQLGLHDSRHLAGRRRQRPQGPITTATDGTQTSAAKATTYTIMEDQTAIPYDPTTTYRVSATIRTATAPTTGSPNVYVGLTGIDADGNRVNISGQNTLSAQIYCAARGTQPGSTYTTYTGYVSGTATPGGAGFNTDPSNPQRVRPEIVAVRPLVYLLYNCTDGVQYLDTFTIHTVPENGGAPLASQLTPGQQLTLGQGTANAETVTVAAVSATSPGWTTATVTTTTATTKTHAAGDVVCEPLPAGKNDPTAWDATAAFDSIAFAY